MRSDHQTTEDRIPKPQYPVKWDLSRGKHASELVFANHEPEKFPGLRIRRHSADESFEAELEAASSGNTHVDLAVLAGGPCSSETKPQQTGTLSASYSRPDVESSGDVDGSVL